MTKKLVHFSEFFNGMVCRTSCGVFDDVINDALDTIVEREKNKWISQYNSSNSTAYITHR